MIKIQQASSGGGGLRGFYAVSIFCLNFWICHELFTTEYTDRVSAGDASFISISRYIRDHWQDDSWWPVWYTGIPGHNAYPPLLHSIVAFVSGIQGVSAALAHHEAAATNYALAGATIFAFSCWLGYSLNRSLFTALAFSLLSPSTLLLPSAWIGAGGVSGPWRLCVLVAYGDAPHMFAAALIPLAIIAIDLGVRKFTPLRAGCASVCIAAVLLTNWLGTAALLGSIAMYLVALANTKRDGLKILRVFAVGVFAYALACPWIPPSTIALIATNGQHASEGDFSHDVQLFPIRALIAVLFILSAKILFKRWDIPFRVQLIFFLALCPGSLPLINEWFHVAILPLPHRYVWEMDFALTLVYCAVMHYMFRRLAQGKRLAFAILASVMALRQVVAYRDYAVGIIHSIDMSATVESQSAFWLKDHYPLARIFAIGTVSYWLNNFSDQPQLSGGFEHATPNAENRRAIDEITNGDANSALLWLRAMGVDIAVAGGPGTRAPFRMVNNPAKFALISQEIWREGDDAMFLIPRRSRSLAQVTRRDDIVLSPVLPQIRRYVNSLEDTALPTASLVWTSGHSVAISGSLSPGEIISMQISYSPAWRARVNGRPVPIQPDGLGMMYIDPMCSGTCLVDAQFGKGIEMVVTNTVALGAIGIWLLFFLRPMFAKQRRPGAVTLSDDSQMRGNQKEH